MARRLTVLVCALALASLGAAPAAGTDTAVGADPVASAGDADPACAVTQGTPVLLDEVDALIGGALSGKLPVSTGVCDGVRPGALLHVDGGGQCTFNVMFTGSDGRDYITTAGHCVGERGEHVYGSNGPEARDVSGQRVGQFVYAVFEGIRDFGVIRVDDGVATDPQMCLFGGPTGIHDELTNSPVLLQHFGQGLALGATVPARTALAQNLADPDTATAVGALLLGDSGSPIISAADGRVVGVVVTVGAHVGNSGDVGTMGITRMAPQLRMAEDALGINLRLQTAPQL